MDMRHFGLTALLIGITTLAGCGGGSDSTDGVDADILVNTTYSACSANTLTTFVFATGGRGTMTTQPFGDATCTTGGGTATSTDFTYVLGQQELALDGQTATRMNRTTNGTTLFTLLRLSGGSIGIQNMQLGSTGASSAGRDGSSSGNRHNGIDTSITYVLR